MDLLISQSLNPFSYSPAFFSDLTAAAVAHAKKLGASDAAASASEASGLSVGVRMGELETLEFNRDKGLAVTVYVGRQRGHASSSDFSDDAIQATVRAAFDIARFTAEDPAAGLPDAQDVVAPEDQKDLDLFHPWGIDPDAAQDMARSCEAAALAVDGRVSNSEGASVSAQHSHFFARHTHGFEGGYASSRHSISVVPIAQQAGQAAEMQRDYWFSSMRDPVELARPEVIGRYAAERTLSRLGSRKIPTGQYPVLFEAPIAAGLLGLFVQAISGGALYRQTTFLQDSLEQMVFADHIDVTEDPFVLRGKGSSPFDEEGVRVCPRSVVSEGRVQTYFLSSYSARKLGMKTTGHAGGSHNLRLASRHTRADDDLRQMLKTMNRGLFITELMGQGVNLVTGDYSRGASGFWVEHGEIVHPVQEITIAGNLRDMFRGIEAVGSDAYNMGARTLGSVLINRMTVAGA